MDAVAYSSTKRQRTDVAKCSRLLGWYTDEIVTADRNYFDRIGEFIGRCARVGIGGKELF